ncbi:MAG: histidine kinase [Bacillota bacterium]|nr:histidine kinase [Bacillota bacterium]
MRNDNNNHIEAIPASAAAYMEVNLTKDIVNERSDEYTGGISKYSDMHRWLSENLIVGNRDKFSEVGDREYLLRRFNEGERRISVPFVMKVKGREELPCRKLFFLYKERESGDVCAFCVIYDLTEEQRKEKEMKMLEQELRMSRIRNFTSQMQPHFLYNALGSIQEVMLIDPEYASELLGYFTVHLRNCIRAMTKDEPLPFAQELENIKAYINIEKMRFGDKLRVHYDILWDEFDILPLTIQPIVENAIRHGIYGKGREGGDVFLRSWEEEDAFIVEVEDTGTGFDVNEYREQQSRGQSESTGLMNVSFRLEQVMGAGLDITSEIGKGTTVTVRIPKGGERYESDNR